MAKNGAGKCGWSRFYGPPALSCASAGLCSVSFGGLSAFFCLGPGPVDTVRGARAYPVSISAAPCRPFVFCFDSPLYLPFQFVFVFFLPHPFSATTCQPALCSSAPPLIRPRPSTIGPAQTLSRRKPDCAPPSPPLLRNSSALFRAPRGSLVEALCSSSCGLPSFPPRSSFPAALASALLFTTRSCLRTKYSLRASCIVGLAPSLFLHAHQPPFCIHSSHSALCLFLLHTPGLVRSRHWPALTRLCPLHTVRSNEIVWSLTVNCTFLLGLAGRYFLAIFCCPFALNFWRFAPALG